MVHLQPLTSILIAVHEVVRSDVIRASSVPSERVRVLVVNVLEGGTALRRTHRQNDAQECGRDLVKT